MKVLRTLNRVQTFSEMHRNMKISFLQHAAEDIGTMQVTCANCMGENGINCIVIDNLFDTIPENSLVHYLRQLLFHAKSSYRDRVV